MMRVPVEPKVLDWAVGRARPGRGELLERFAGLGAWLKGRDTPTLGQLEKLASATDTPVGFFFLASPPRLELPIPDFRTAAGPGPQDPSADLLETVYACQRRQDWYAAWSRSRGEEPLAFVGSLTLDEPVVQAAASIRKTLGLDLEARGRLKTWEKALQEMVESADEAGVLVMVAGYVGSQTHRTLDTEEFRGFALSDPHAPLVFVNGRDTKSAQMFTLAHELAHLWLGATSLSDATARRVPRHRTERWCNRVAAELLVPLGALRERIRPDEEPHEAMRRLARWFKVSTLVVLRRLHDAGAVARGEFTLAYEAELARLMSLRPKGNGGNYYRTAEKRVSRRLIRAVAVSTLEGRTGYTEGFSLTGCRNTRAFARLAREAGVPVGELGGEAAPPQGGGR